MNINIYEITKLISRQQVVALGLFNDAKSRETSKYLIFFNFIKENKIVNDNEAIQVLSYSNLNSFQRFKRRYTEKLLSYLLLTDTKVHTDDKTSDTYYELIKLYLAARILHRRNNIRNALIIYEYVNKEALKYQYLDLLQFTIYYIKQHYAFIDPDVKLYRRYQKLNEKIERDYIRINYIQNYYDEISHRNIILDEKNVDNFKASTLSTARELLKEMKESDSFEFKNKVYEIAAYAFNINDKLEESINYSEQSIELSFEHFKAPHTKILAAYRDILAAYLRLKDFENARIYLNKILEISRSINHNYFRYKSLEYTLYINTQEYDKLFLLTQEILSIKKLKDFRIHFEEWSIREAFVNILVEAGKVSPELMHNSKRKFKLNRFINDVEFYAKDKRGTNISIQVIQLIHYLIRKDYDKINDRLDSLNQYTFRYLRNDDTLRSNCLIKMLLKLPEAEYHPMRTKRYVAKYSKKLAENPFEISMKEIAVEIIPYEQLWDIIMEILNTNQDSKKKGSRVAR